MVICPNPKCGSTRVIWQGKKYKCLDCHKTFKTGKSDKKTAKDNAIAMMALMSRASGVNMMRDLGLDNPKFNDSDVNNVERQ